jgi:hypothetical protein
VQSSARCSGAHFLRPSLQTKVDLMKLCDLRTLVQQLDGMRDMLLPGVAAQRHPMTLRDFQTCVQHDFARPGPYPPMVLPQYDNFAALCERGRRFPSLVLVSAPSWSGSSTLIQQLAQLSNSRPATRWNGRCAPTWSGSSTPIPQICATLQLTYGNQIEREMCSYLEWQLNVLNIDRDIARLSNSRPG